jgi:hypothetical protein
MITSLKTKVNSYYSQKQFYDVLDLRLERNAGAIFMVTTTATSSQHWNLYEKQKIELGFKSIASDGGKRLRSATEGSPL